MTEVQAQQKIAEILAPNWVRCSPFARAVLYESAGKIIRREKAIPDLWEDGRDYYRIVNIIKQIK